MLYGDNMIKLHKKSQVLDSIKELCLEFAALGGKKPNWEFWRNGTGSLIDNGVAECLIAYNKDAQPIGFLIYALFPDLISGELNATEMLWYADKNSSLAGVRLLDKMIVCAKNKKCFNVNVTNMTFNPKVGDYLNKQGFIHTESHHTLRLVY